MTRSGKKGTKIPVEHVASQAAGTGSSEKDNSRVDETLETDESVASEASDQLDSSNEVLEPEVIEDLEQDESETSAKGEPGNGVTDAKAAAKSDGPKADPPSEEDVLLSALTAAADAKDRYLRLQAEWDNFRKRSNAEREQNRIQASERIVKELIPVIDDFERALDHAAKEPDLPSLIGGIEAVHTKLLGVLTKEHVEVISPAGEAFDATRHQAVGTVEDTEVFDETVRDVYQVGYEMGGKVIRPAMVTVTTGGPKRPVEQPDDSTDVDNGDKEKH